MVRGVLIVAIAVHSWCTLFCAADVAACTIVPVCPCCPVEDESSCCCKDPASEPNTPKPVTCCIISTEPMGMPPKAPKLSDPMVFALLQIATLLESHESLTPILSRDAPPWLTDHSARATHALLCIWIN